MKRRRLGLSTRAIHGDPKARADWTAVAPPLYQSSTFTNPVGSTAEVLYSRYGNNPNQVDIGRRLALLEGADAALFLASGMAAAALAHLAVLRPGDHLLASEWIYGGVYRLFREELDRKSTRLNSSHGYISYAVFCLKKKTKTHKQTCR